MRRNRHRWMAALLSCLLLAGQLGVPALASDLEGHAHREVMEKWSVLGWFTGDGGGVYRPDDAISRAEFMALVNRMKGYWTPSPDVARYTDVPADAWYAPIVAAALTAGYITGRGNGIMAPLDRLTRQEALVILARAEALPPAEPYTVAQNAAPWAADGLNRCISAGLFPFSGGLAPALPLTRSQAVLLLDCALEQVRHYPFPGEYGPETGRGTASQVTISAGGVTLRSMDISGDLIIEIPSDGDVIRLIGVTVGGQLLVTGDRNRLVLEDCTITAPPEEQESPTEAATEASPPSPGGSGSGGSGGVTPTPSPVFTGHDAADKAVPWGTGTALLSLPAQVTLRADTGAAATADALWDTAGYRPDTPGAYTLTARLTSAASWAPKTISIRVTVEAPVTVTGGLETEPVTVKSSDSAEAAAARLPGALTLTLSDGSRITVSSAWSCAAYSSASGAVNVFAAAISGLPYYVTPPVITAAVTVADNDAPAAAAVRIVPSPAVLQRPAAGETEAAALTAEVIDQFGGVLDQAVSLSLKENYPGVAIMVKAGVHTVEITGDCAATEIIVAGTVAGTALRGEAVIRISDAEAAAASIDFDGAANIITLSEHGARLRLSAVVRDQNGEAMPGKAAAYALETEVSGVTLEPEGLLTVAATVAPGTSLTVAASWEGLTARLTLTVTREASRPASLEPGGPESVAIPAAGEVQATYRATVLDQFGQELAHPVTWSLKEDVPGVSLTESGVLTVSAISPESAWLTLTAGAGSVTRAYPVVLVKNRAPAPNASLALRAGVLECTLLPFGGQALERVGGVSVSLESGSCSVGFVFSAHALAAGGTESLLPSLATLVQAGAQEDVKVKIRSTGKGGYADSDWTVLAEIPLVRAADAIAIRRVDSHAPSHYLLTADAALDENSLYAVYFLSGSALQRVFITYPAYPNALEAPYTADGPVTAFALSQITAEQDQDGFRLLYTPPTPYILPSP